MARYENVSAFLEFLVCVCVCVGCGGIGWRSRSSDYRVLRRQLDFLLDGFLKILNVHVVCLKLVSFPKVFQFLSFFFYNCFLKQLSLTLSWARPKTQVEYVAKATEFRLCVHSKSGRPTKNLQKVSWELLQRSKICEEHIIFLGQRWERDSPSDTGASLCSAFQYTIYISCSLPFSCTVPFQS